MAILVSDEHLKEVESERDRYKADAERLDALQKLSTGYGKGWLLRMSTTGRGLRLHETSQDGAVREIREAIDNYIAHIREADKEANHE